ncbi:MAG: hypothetical protein ACOH2K_01530 [Burkholderiaceae bacterium]
MQKRHDDELINRLEQILTEGCVYISWNELYLWYGMQKLAAGTYRDLTMRWQEISDGKTMTDGTELGDLVFVQSPTKNSPGIYLFGSNMPQAVYEE